VTVIKTPTGWAVMDGDRVLSEHPTQGAAWRWLDKRERRASWVRSSTANWTGQGVYHEPPADPDA
jgi:hypothetical protein